MHGHYKQWDEVQTAGGGRAHKCTQHATRNRKNTHTWPSACCGHGNRAKKVLPVIPPEARDVEYSARLARFQDALRVVRQPLGAGIGPLRATAIRQRNRANLVAASNDLLSTARAAGVPVQVVAAAINAAPPPPPPPPPAPAPAPAPAPGHNAGQRRINRRRARRH
eukprot:jgi/Mesvir1/23471/Mv22320-RA.1